MRPWCVPFKQPILHEGLQYEEKTALLGSCFREWTFIYNTEVCILLHGSDGLLRHWQLLAMTTDSVTRLLPQCHDSGWFVEGGNLSDLVKLDCLGFGLPSAVLLDNYLRLCFIDLSVESSHLAKCNLSRPLLIEPLLRALPYLELVELSDGIAHPVSFACLCFSYKSVSVS